MTLALERPTTAPTHQRRSFDPLGPVQLRAAGDSANLTADIRASTYWVVDYYGTCRAPGAFDTLSEEMERFQVLLHHDPWRLIGFVDAFDAEDDGLDVTVIVVDDEIGDGHSTIAGMRNGLRYTASFGFDITGQRQATLEDPLDLTHAPAWCRSDPTLVTVHTSVKTWEVSFVTWGADYTARPTDVRSFRTAEALEAVITGLRDGSLDDRQTAALIAALEERSAPGETPDDAAELDPPADDTGLLAGLMTALTLGERP